MRPCGKARKRGYNPDCIARKYFIDFGQQPVEESLPKVVRQIFYRYKRHKNIIINLVNEVPEIKSAAENYSIDRLIYRASLIYLQIYQDSFPDKSLRKVHDVMNLVFSSAIKQYLTEADPPFDDEVFLTELSSVMLGYLAYDQTISDGTGTPAEEA